MALVELVYASAAVRPFPDAELALLLSKARMNNARLGLTGLLAYHQRSFLQALEGEAEVVAELYATIEKDKRHDRILVLSRKAIDARSFGDWKMGFVKVDRALARQLDGHFDMFKPDAGFQKLDAADSRPALMLRGFLDGKWRRHVDGR
jgi:Sensors of blue-light using FAD